MQFAHLSSHLNPAVRPCHSYIVVDNAFTLASICDFSWKKVPAYRLAQLLGALRGAGVVYANYYHAINATAALGSSAL